MGLSLTIVSNNFYNLPKLTNQGSLYCSDSRFPFFSHNYFHYVCVLQEVLFSHILVWLLKHSYKHSRHLKKKKKKKAVNMTWVILLQTYHHLTAQFFLTSIFEARLLDSSKNPEITRMTSSGLWHHHGSFFRLWKSPIRATEDSALLFSLAD